MTCVNWGLTILAAVIFVFTVWPNWGGATATMWVVGIASVLIVIISWTGVECKPCRMAKEAQEKDKKKKK